MAVQNTHQPVLILEAAKETCHLSRNICGNIAIVTKNVCCLGMIRNKVLDEVCI